MRERCVLWEGVGGRGVCCWRVGGGMVGGKVCAVGGRVWEGEVCAVGGCGRERCVLWEGVGGGEVCAAGGCGRRRGVWCDVTLGCKICYIEPFIYIHLYQSVLCSSVWTRRLVTLTSVRMVRLP